MPSLIPTNPSNLHSFFDALESRGNAFGWTAPDGITCYIPDHTENNLHVNGGEVTFFFDKYAEIPLERVRKWEESLLAEFKRRDQDFNIFVPCHHNSFARVAVAIQQAEGRARRSTGCWY
mmetsp:Transcript_2043/g.4137  ORF Transcript_2043/g.4137 Transcript_2043/m.4137 type:complete len:120 (+) Transcript_2043:276-635(+)